MKYLIMAIGLFFNATSNAVGEDKTFPSVNEIFSNAYFSEGSVEEAYFWIGSGAARCSAAFEMAFYLNQRAEDIFGSDLKGYIGNAPPLYWENLAVRAKDISLFTLENSGVDKADLSGEFETTYVMSIRLYMFLMNEIDDLGMPNIQMLEQDLLDCRDFFSQDFETPTYMPRKTDQKIY